MADIIVYANSTMADDTGGGLTSLTAKKYLNSAMALCRSNTPVNGHILNIAFGEYTTANDSLIIDSVNLDSIRIIAADQTFICPVGSEGFKATVAGIEVYGTGFNLSSSTNKNVIYITGNSTFVFEDIGLIAPEGHTTYSLCNITDGSVYFNRLTMSSIFYSADARYTITATGTASIKINNAISLPSPFSDVASSMYFNTSGTAELYNSLIFGAAGHGINCVGTGIYTIQNSVIGGGAKNSSAYPISRSGGTLSVGNTLIVANPFDGNKTISGAYTDTGGNSLVSLNPKYTKTARNGYICPCIDDAGNFGHALEIEALLAARGMSGSFFLERIMWDDEDTPDLRNMISRGVMEVGTHTHTHSSLQASGKLWDITKGAETVTIDRSTDTISLSGGGSITEFKAKTLQSIKIELEALGATVVPTTTYSTVFSISGKIYHLAKGEVLDATIAGSTANLLTDPTANGGLFKAEMRDPKQELLTLIGSVIDPQTGTSYMCNSIGAPYNGETVDARAAAIASGFTSFRAMYPTESSTTSGKFNYAADLYRIYVISIGSLKGDGLETTIKRNARALAFSVAQNGMCVSLLGHTLADMTLEQWGWVLDEFAEYGNNIHVCSQQRYAEDVRTEGWIETSGVYSKPLLITDGNYHLQPTSPCLGAGVSIPAIHEQATPATDFDGNIIHFLPPSIGPYDGQGSTKTIAADFTPTGYSVRCTAESPVKVKLAEHDLSVDLSGLTDAAPYIQVKAGSKRVAGFIGKGANTYVEGSGGGGNSSNEIFSSNFGNSFT